MLAIAKLHTIQEPPPQNIQIIVVSKSNQSYFAERKGDTFWLDQYSTIEENEIIGWFDLDDIYIRS